MAFCENRERPLFLICGSVTSEASKQCTLEVVDRFAKQPGGSLGRPRQTVIGSILRIEAAHGPRLQGWLSA